jgi:hypothetical protein
MSRNVTVRATDELVDLMNEATKVVKSGTAKKFTRNDLMVDAIEAYCKEVLKNKKNKK